MRGFSFLTAQGIHFIIDLPTRELKIIIARVVFIRKPDFFVIMLLE
jgi:hypothetical protein